MHHKYLILFTLCLTPSFSCERKPMNKSSQSVPTVASTTLQTRPTVSTTTPSTLRISDFDYKDRPSALIAELKQSDIVNVTYAPPDWLAKGDIEQLIGLIHSSEPCGTTCHVYSSTRPRGSTVGREALFLIEGYKTNKYPPRLTSKELSLTAEQAEDWYRKLEMKR